MVCMHQDSLTSACSMHTTDHSSLHPPIPSIKQATPTHAHNHHLARASPPHNCYQPVTYSRQVLHYSLHLSFFPQPLPRSTTLTMPVFVNFAHTSAIPSSLSREQVWRGLLYKCKHPESMVPAKSCEVLKEDENGLTRHVVFNSGQESDEVITYQPYSLMDFTMPNGTVVQNIISGGDDGGQLYLTFTFHWLHADLGQSNTAEIEQRRQQGQSNSKMAVTKTLQVIAQMVEDGSL